MINKISCNRIFLQHKIFYLTATLVYFSWFFLCALFDFIVIEDKFDFRTKLYYIYIYIDFIESLMNYDRVSNCQSKQHLLKGKIIFQRDTFAQEYRKHYDNFHFIVHVSGKNTHDASETPKKKQPTSARKGFRIYFDSIQSIQESTKCTHTQCAVNAPHLRKLFFGKPFIKAFTWHISFIFFCVLFITQQVIFPTHFPLISLYCLFTQWLDINTQYKRHKNHKRVKEKNNTDSIL